MTTILITGATGKVSSAAIAALHGKGHTLVALVRDAAKAQPLAAQGIELRVGDLDKLRTIEHLLGGVDVALQLTPPGFLAPAQNSNLLWALRNGGVKHVVRLSAVGAAHTAPTINSRLHALSDGELAGSGIAYTILKPHFFAQNLLGSAQTIAEQGMLYSAIGDAKLPMIDVRDVGETVAAVLAQPTPHAGKTYTLTGPAAISLHDVAAAIGQAIGRPVKYQALPVDAMIDQFTKWGADEYVQVSMRDYFNAYAQGWQNAPTSSVNDITGQTPRGIDVFAQDFAAAFGKK